MLTKNKTKLFILIPFIIAELLLGYYTIFKMGSWTKYTAFSSIVIAFLVALIFIDVKKHTALINLALAFTVFADICLVLSNPIKQTLGVILFIFAQTCYFLYIYLTTESKKIKLAHIITRCSVITVAIIALFIVLKDKVDFLSFISLFYIANLATNIVFSFFDKEKLLFSIGLIFFILCDIIVGLSAAEGVYLTIPVGSFLYDLIHSNINFIWLCYVPSQTLITVFVAINKK